MNQHLSPRHPLSLACLAALCSLALPAQAQQDQPTPQVAEHTLPEVVVKGAKDANALPAAAPGGQAATGVRLGILGNTSVLDAPFSVSGYTQQAIKDQQARTLADVLQNDPSVRFTTNSGHMLEHFRIRGLDVNGPDVAFNGLYGVAPTGHVPTEFLERVEVLRGPNALLSGMSPSAALGGMINLVPKRAGARPLTELTTSYSSKSYGQVHLDAGRRFGEDERLGVRFNGAYGTGDTGVAEQKKGRELGAIAIDYKGDHWNLALDAYSSRETIDNGSPAMYGLATSRNTPPIGVVVGLGTLVPVPDSGANLFRGTYGTSKDKGIAVRGEVQLNKDWSTYLSLGASDSQGNGLMFGTRVIVTQPDGTAVGYVYNVDTFTRGRVGEVGLRGNFATGSVNHQIVASATSLNIKDGSANRASQGWAQNIYNPVAPVLPTPPSPAQLGNNNVMSSLGVADTLAMADGKVLLTLGARLQRVEQKLKSYDESKVSPSLGLVLKPWGADTSLYANYMEGLSPGEKVAATGYTNSGDSLKPIQTRQAEIGVKLRQGSFTHTFSAFQITKPTAVDQGNASGAPTRVEGGKQQVKGLEWITFGKATATLSLLGGVTHQQAELRDTGRDSWGVPDWTANVGAEWTTPLKGLSLNGRLIYNGKQWVDSANTLQLPTSYRIDVGAKYLTALGTTPVTLNAFVENVTDHDYWSGMFSDGYVMSGPPRTLRLAATFSF